MTIHEGFLYNCDQCKFKSTRKHNPNVHVDIVHKIIMLSCGICDKTFTRKDGLQNHIKQAPPPEAF